MLWRQCWKADRVQTVFRHTKRKRYHLVEPLPNWLSVSVTRDLDLVRSTCLRTNFLCACLELTPMCQWWSCSYLYGKPVEGHLRAQLTYKRFAWPSEAGKVLPSFDLDLPVVPHFLRNFVQSFCVFRCWDDWTWINVACLAKSEIVVVGVSAYFALSLMWQLCL